MAAYDMDPDVVHNLLDVCTLSNNGSPSIITRYDPDLSSSYVREGFCHPFYVENDEAVLVLTRKNYHNFNPWKLLGCRNSGMNGILNLSLVIFLI
ncbi:hypothetical protein AHAS_Ahas09G0303500 [Arachis hypogaea]